MVKTDFMEITDTNERLSELGLTREGLMEVIDACVAAAGGCTDNDPPMAKGWDVWRYGVRRLREVFCSQGWEKNNAGGFCTIVNHDLRIRIAIMNTDDGTGIIDNIPQNKSKKGVASEDAITTNQQLLLPGFEEKEDNSLVGYSTWHLCIYVNGDDVRAEFSLLNEMSSGYITGCHERIILVGQDDWKVLDLDKTSNDLGPEFNVEVYRR